jgi:hypothetical protein
VYSSLQLAFPRSRSSASLLFHCASGESELCDGVHSVNCGLSPASTVLNWHGPYGWPGASTGADISSLAATSAGRGSGVYLWTVEYGDGFLLYAAGITRRPFVQRFREHTRRYRTGVYTLFNVAALRQSRREEVWHGYWTKARPADRIAEYARRRAELERAAEEQLAAFRVFVATTDGDLRILQRIEAAIMYSLYAAPGPTAAVPDRGMALAPRRRSEQPLLIRSLCGVTLHGLPAEFSA